MRVKMKKFCPINSSIYSSVLSSCVFSGDYIHMYVSIVKLEIQGADLLEIHCSEKEIYFHGNVLHGVGIS